MRGALVLILVIALLVIIGLDGYSMFVAFSDSRELALGAAQTAAATLQRTGDEGVARTSADTYTTEHGGELLRLEHGKSDAQWYRAWVSVEPKTFAFQSIPILNRHLAQVAETSYTF